MIRTRVLCSWNIQPRRKLNDWKIEEMGRLLDLLEKYSLGDNELNDEMFWKLNGEEKFSVKSMYEGMCSNITPSYPEDCVWHLCIQLKASFLVWELWWNHALMIDNLVRRRMIIPNWCCLCRNDMESVDHMFLHCSWSQGFWNHFLQCLGVA